MSGHTSLWGGRFEGGPAGSFVVTRTGSLDEDLLVTIAFGGTAGRGTDYEAPAGDAVVILAGQASATVVVRALPDAGIDPGEQITLAVAPGTGYVPAGEAASVTIAEPSAVSARVYA